MHLIYEIYGICRSIVVGDGADHPFLLKRQTDCIL
jgi:hypothetical protein